MKSVPEKIEIFFILLSLFQQFSQLLNRVLQLYLPVTVVVHYPLVQVLLLRDGDGRQLGAADAVLFAETFLRRLKESTSGTERPYQSTRVSLVKAVTVYLLRNTKGFCYLFCKSDRFVTNHNKVFSCHSQRGGKSTADLTLTSL